MSDDQPYTVSVTFEPPAPVRPHLVVGDVRPGQRHQPARHPADVGLRPAQEPHDRRTGQRHGHRQRQQHQRHAEPVHGEHQHDPSTSESPLIVPATAARNSGSVQPIEATAYDTPNTNIDPTVRSRPPRSSRGSRRSARSRPASPRPGRTGRGRSRSRSTARSRRPAATSSSTTAPATANTARNPADTARATCTAWATLARGTLGLASSRPEEVRQVGGEHGEPARVDRRHHAERQVVGPGLVGADGDASRRTPRSRTARRCRP